MRVGGAAGSDLASRHWGARDVARRDDEREAGKTHRRYRTIACTASTGR